MVFDPYDLDLDVTPLSIRQQLRRQEWASAIILAFRLNEKDLKQEVLETVPHDQSECLLPSRLELVKPVDDGDGDAFPAPVGVICASLPGVYVEKLLGFVAVCLEKSSHLQFYMMWAQNLLMLHGHNLKNRCVNTVLSLPSLSPW